MHAVDISRELGMFAGRDDNMRSFMKELYEAVAKDVLGIRQGMRELRRTEVDLAMASGCQTCLADL